MRTFVAFDVSNLYLTLKMNFRGKFNYARFMNFIKAKDEVVKAIAYGAQFRGEADLFLTALRSLGIDIKYKRPEITNLRLKSDWDVGITVDVIRHLPAVEKVILVSSDGDFAPLADYITQNGKDILIIGSGISESLKKFPHLEITQEFIFETTKSGKRGGR